MWVLLSVGSAFFLGMYDVMKKVSLNGNAVLPVLLFSSLSGAILFAFPVILSEVGVIESGSMIFIPQMNLEGHLLVLLKTFIVLSSWILAFFAVKNLPITVVTPIRATGPLWTLIGALIIFSERLSPMQWIGIMVTLIFFYLFSTTGKLDGISFRNNKYIYFIIGATLIGAMSGLFDKYLMRRLDRMAVQAYFTLYQVVLMLPVVMLLWWPRRKKSTSFQFRWSIPMIGIFLIIADFMYFYALAFPDSLISVISALRRACVVVTFVVGAMLFKEQNLRKKGQYLLGILIGISFLIFGK